MICEVNHTYSCVHEWVYGWVQLVISVLSPLFLLIKTKSSWFSNDTRNRPSLCPSEYTDSRMIAKKCGDSLEVSLCIAYIRERFGWEEVSSSFLDLLPSEKERAAHKPWKLQGNLKKWDFLELVCLYFGSSFSGALSSHQLRIRHTLPCVNSQAEFCKCCPWRWARRTGLPWHCLCSSYVRETGALHGCVVIKNLIANIGGATLHFHDLIPFPVDPVREGLLLSTFTCAPFVGSNLSTDPQLTGTRRRIENQTVWSQRLTLLLFCYALLF